MKSTRGHRIAANLHSLKISTMFSNPAIIRVLSGSGCCPCFRHALLSVKEEQTTCQDDRRRPNRIEHRAGRTQEFGQAGYCNCDSDDRMLALLHVTPDHCPVGFWVKRIKPEQQQDPRDENYHRPRRRSSRERAGISQQGKPAHEGKQSASTM